MNTRTNMPPINVMARYPDNQVQSEEPAPTKPK